MRCPLCDVPMREVERRGVRIDVCPECRGIWLDRGELDKLLAREPVAEPGVDREGQGALRGSPTPQRRRADDDADEWDDGRPLADVHRHGEGYRRKKKSWLSELFDFDFGD